MADASSTSRSGWTRDGSRGGASYGLSYQAPATATASRLQAASFFPTGSSTSNQNGLSTAHSSLIAHAGSRYHQIQMLQGPSGRYGPAPAGFTPPTRPTTSEPQGFATWMHGAHPPPDYKQYQQQPHTFRFPPAPSQHDQPAGCSGVGYYYQEAAAHQDISPEGAAKSIRFGPTEDWYTPPPPAYQEDDLRLHMKQVVDLAERNTKLAARMAVIVGEYQTNAQEIQRAVAAIKDLIR